MSEIGLPHGKSCSGPAERLYDDLEETWQSKVKGRHIRISVYRYRYLGCKTVCNITKLHNLASESRTLSARLLSLWLQHAIPGSHIETVEGVGVGVSAAAALRRKRWDAAWVTSAVQVLPVSSDGKKKTGLSIVCANPE